jgi:porphobilinogen synthase
MENQGYPITHRRLRASSHIRELAATVRLSHKSFVQPLFVEENLKESKTTSGLRVDSKESVLNEIEECLKNGISKFLLFPIPASKVNEGFDFSFVTSVIRSIKSKFGNSVWLACDVCLCSYTQHGHCGILNPEQTKLLNHETVIELAAYAHQLADAGADCIAPSDMTDGRIDAIRKKLNGADHDDVSIMSYSAKFSSQFYGPFRDACQSAPQAHTLKNRKTYQLSPFNPNDALASTLRDLEEGADIVMVKPAAHYTDIIAKLRSITTKPIAAYHVSGEYMAIESLAEKNLVNRAAAHLEVWASLQRSGADIIISYASKHAKEWIDKMEY